MRPSDRPLCLACFGSSLWTSLVWEQARASLLEDERHLTAIAPQEGRLLPSTSPPQLSGQRAAGV